MIIAIDGPAGSGKSQIASLISSRLGFFNLNSGDFYRAFAYSFLKNNRDVNNYKDINEELKQTEIFLKDGNMYVNGAFVPSGNLHTSQIDEISSVLSVNREVREYVNERIRNSCKNLDIVCEGRDITSVVFPDAEVKIFLDADIEERAKRRSIERGEDYNKVLSELKDRDERDINRPFGALKRLENVNIIDSTALTIEEVYNKIIKMIEEYNPQGDNQ